MIIAKLKKQSRVAKEPYTLKRLKKDFKQDYPFWTLALIPIVIVFIFQYIPMYGVQIAFKDFKVTQGIWGSEWVGFDNFKLLFRSKDFRTALFNTFELSFLRLLFSFPAPIILALLFNEIGNLRFKKTVQAFSYAPSFISWVIIAGLVNVMFSLDGPVNALVQFFGGEPQAFMADPKLFKPMVLGTHIWKNVGMGTIIYMAALTSVDPNLYEACAIDGGGRLKQIFHVTLPSIKGIIAIQLIGQLGSIMKNNFEQVFLLMNEATSLEAMTLELYNYNIGLVQSNYSIGAATGLWMGLISLILTIIANFVVKKLTDEGMW